MLSSCGTEFCLHRDTKDILREILPDVICYFLEEKIYQEKEQVETAPPGQSCF